MMSTKFTIVIFLLVLSFSNEASSYEYNVINVKNINIKVPYTDSAFDAQAIAIKSAVKKAFRNCAFYLKPDLKPNFADAIEYKKIARSLIKFKINEENISEDNTYNLSINAMFDMDTVTSITDNADHYENKICKDCFIIPVTMKNNELQIWNNDWFNAWEKISLQSPIYLPAENIENINRLQNMESVRKFAEEMNKDCFIITLTPQNKGFTVKTERIKSNQVQTKEFNEKYKYSNENIALITFNSIFENTISVDVFANKEYDSHQIIGFYSFASWAEVRSALDAIGYEFLYISEKGCVIDVPDQDFPNLRNILLEGGYFLVFAGERKWIAEKTE